MIKNYTLLKSQKNRVYELLREGGLEPAEFSWDKMEIAASLAVSRLNYRDGAYYFQFSSYEVNAWCMACPGQFRSLDYDYPKTWEEQEGVFRKWLSCLKREITAPDLWGELAKYKIVLAPEPTAEAANEIISGQDAEQIGQALVRVGDALVKELVLDNPEAALVRSKLAYLAEAAKRQRSRDWVYTALGAYVTIAVTLAIPEAALAALWKMFQAEVGGFLHLTTWQTSKPAPAPPSTAAAPGAPAAEEAPRRKKLGLF